jgi:hypothetical protein
LIIRGRIGDHPLFQAWCPTGSGEPEKRHVANSFTTETG